MENKSGSAMADDSLAGTVVLAGPDDLVAGSLKAEVESEATAEERSDPHA